MFTLKPELSLNSLMNLNVKSDNEQGQNKTFENKLLALFIPKSGTITQKDACEIMKWRTDLYLTNKNWDLQSFSLFDLRLPYWEKDELRYKTVTNLNCKENYNSENLVNLSPERPIPFESLFLNQNKFKDILITFDLITKKHQSWLESLESPFIQMKNNLKQYSFNDKYDVAWIGSPAYEYYTLQSLIQMLSINFLFGLLLMGICFLIFGTWRIGAICSFCIFISAIILHGLMALAKQNINIIISIIFLITSITALEDIIFLVSAPESLLNRPRKLFRQYIYPCFMTSFSTIIGFGALVFSNNHVIKRFGLWTALGALIEWWVIFLIFPIFIKKFPNTFKLTQQRNKFRIFSFDQLLNLKPFVSFRYVISAIFFIGIVASFFINFNDSPENLFSPNHILTKDSEKFLANRGWKSAIPLAFDQQPEMLTTFLNSAAQQHSIHSIENPLTLVDLLKQQNAKIPKTIEAQVFIKNLDVKSLNQLGTWLRSQCQKIGNICAPQGELMSYLKFAEEAPQTLFSSLIISFILITVLIWSLLKTTNISGMTFYIFSSCFGLFSLICILSFLQIEINFLTAIFASVLMGLTGDNAIQFIIHSRKHNLELSLKERGGGALNTTILLSLSSLCFLLSDFRAVRILGMILSLGFILMFIGDYFGLKSLNKKS